MQRAVSQEVRRSGGQAVRQGPESAGVLGVGEGEAAGGAGDRLSCVGRRASPEPSDTRFIASICSLFRPIRRFAWLPSWGGTVPLDACEAVFVCVCGLSLVGGSFERAYSNVRFSNFLYSAPLFLFCFHVLLELLFFFSLYIGRLFYFIQILVTLFCSGYYWTSFCLVLILVDT